MEFLKAILMNDVKTQRSREFFVDCEDACCQECVKTGMCGQGRRSVWDIAKWCCNEYTDGDWHDPGGEIVCPKDHDSEVRHPEFSILQLLSLPVDFFLFSCTPIERNQC